MLQAIVNGLVVGAIPGLLAIGLVLIYKGSRIFNFAQAEFGTVAGFAAWIALEAWGLPYALAAVLAVAVAGLLGLGVERFVIRPLFDARRVTLLVATAGIALLIIGVTFNFGGTNPRTISPAVSGLGPQIFGVFVSPQEIFIFAVLGGLAALLAWFFNRTNLGLAILASSEDDFAAELSGIDSKRISATVWLMAGALGGLAGILEAGNHTPIVAGYMTTHHLLAAFVGAVLGGMTSLPGAFLGGEIVGLATSLAEYGNRAWFDGSIPGPGGLVLFLLVLLVLLTRPQGILGQKEALRA